MKPSKNGAESIRKKNNVGLSCAGRRSAALAGGTGLQMKREELNTELKNFRDIRRYIVDVLKENNIDERVIPETLLVFEALYNDMLDQGIDENRLIKVRGVRSFGDVRIKIGFEGRRYVPLSKYSDEATAEDRVMAAFADKMESSYHSGYNNISITAKRSYSRSMMFCVAGILLAAAVYIPLSLLLEPGSRRYLFRELVFPLEKVFTNMVLMVGAPVTFFSLLSHLTDAYIVSERESDMRKINRTTLYTSVFSVLMAVAVSFLAMFLFGTFFSTGASFANTGFNTSLSAFLESLVSTSIFVPFETIAPFPMIVLAALTTYALCSAGLYFDKLKQAIDAGYLIFSRMLTAVIFLLPGACFLAVLDLLLDVGPAVFAEVLGAFLIVVLSLIFMVLYYLARLCFAGVNAGEFVKKLFPLISENYKINSSIDAVPFNIRYCTTKYGMDKKRLEKLLPVLAQLNLDGNCYLITLLGLMLTYYCDIPLTLNGILVIGTLVLFLSLGAPNQPGSCLIGMLIIISYLGIPEMIAFAIITEVAMGNVLNLINTVGDIVTVAVDDAKNKSRLTNAEIKTEAE